MKDRPFLISETWRLSASIFSLARFERFRLLAPDLGDPLLLLALLAQDGRLDLVGQDAAGQEPVERLEALLLALDLGAGRAGA